MTTTNDIKLIINNCKKKVDRRILEKATKALTCPIKMANAQMLRGTTKVGGFKSIRISQQARLVININTNETWLFATHNEYDRFADKRGQYA